MGKKDFIFIIVAVFLTSGILLVGAKGDWLKSKLGVKEQPEPAKFSQSEQQAYATSSENILVSSPGPNEIIKGTVFTIKGQAKVFENALTIKIKDAQLGELWLATTTLVNAPEISQFGPFEIKVDVKPHSGWAILEVLSIPQDGSVIDLVSFLIKISPSL